MINPYQELFAAPGTKAFALAGLLARMPLPMTGIGLITMLSQLRGSYALAGAISATFVLTYALVSPQISRLVDRYGQSRVLPAATSLSVVGFVVLIAASWWQASDWTLFLGAWLAGFMPSISAMIRARWTALYRGHPRLQTAYSLETVLDEVSFIAGPPLSLGLSVAAFPQAGPLVAMFLLILGVCALLGQRATDPSPNVTGVITTTSVPVIRLANMQLLTLLMLAMGIIVGTVDMVSVAFAEQQGQPAAASFILAAYAIGSCLAGLLFGTLKLQTPLHRLLLWGGLATAATTLPMLLVGNIGSLAGVVFVAGLFFAPTMIVAMSLVERLVPAHSLTEGMTWLLAGLNVGVALGAAAAGQVLDASDAKAGFIVSLCAAAAVLLIAFCAHQRFSSRNSSVSTSA